MEKYRLLKPLPWMKPGFIVLVDSTIGYVTNEKHTMVEEIRNYLWDLYSRNDDEWHLWFEPIDEVECTCLKTYVCQVHGVRTEVTEVFARCDEVDQGDTSVDEIVTSEGYQEVDLTDKLELEKFEETLILFKGENDKGMDESDQLLQHILQDRSKINELIDFLKMISRHNDYLTERVRLLSKQLNLYEEKMNHVYDRLEKLEE